MRLRNSPVTVLLLSSCAALALTACKPASQPAAPKAATEAQAQSHGIDLAGMDRNVKPGDDFFAFSNGGWVAKTEIPADRGSFGNFAILAEKANKRTADLIQEMAKTQAAAGSDQQKIGDYYSSYLDEAAIEQKGSTPLKPALDRISAIADKAGLSRELGAELRAD